MLLLRSAAAAAGHDKAVRYANGDRQDDDVASIDHIIPRSEGGRLGFNAVVAHRRCNAERNRRPITPAETARLAALNERRTYRFQEDQVWDDRTGKVARLSAVMAGRFDLLW